MIFQNYLPWPGKIGVFGNFGFSCLLSFAYEFLVLTKLSFRLNVKRIIGVMQDLGIHLNTCERFGLVSIILFSEKSDKVSLVLALSKSRHATNLSRRAIGYFVSVSKFRNFGVTLNRFLTETGRTIFQSVQLAGGLKEPTCFSQIGWPKIES